MTYPPPPGDPNDPGQQPQQPGSYPPPQGSYPPPQGSYPPPQGSYPPPQGSYPPPQGSYPPPQGGSYPQPPYDASGGFNGPQQGYPQQGYPQQGYPQQGYPQQGYPQSGGPQQYSVGDAISVGWERFKANPGTWIGFFVVNFLVIAVAVVIYIFAIIGSALSTDPDTGSSGGVTVGFFAISAVFFVVTLAIIFAFQAAAIQGALLEVTGRKADFGSMFRFRKTGDVIVASLLVGLIVGIGIALFYLPGIIAGFLLSFTLFFVIEDGLSPVEAMKASFRLTTQRFVDVFVLLLLSGIIGGLGTILCYVGVVVTAPIAAIAQAYGFRMFTGKPVAPVRLQ